MKIVSPFLALAMLALDIAAVVSANAQTATPAPVPESCQVTQSATAVLIGCPLPGAASTPAPAPTPPAAPIPADCSGDGSAQATTGVAPQLTISMASWKVKPSCQYPGQYAVGANPATAINDPAKANLGPAIVVDTTNRLLRCYGGPVTIANFLMTPASGPGWQIAGFAGCHDLTVVNDLWSMTQAGTAAIATGPAVNVTIHHVTVKSNGFDNSIGTAIIAGGSGTLDVHASDLRGSPTDEIDIAGTGDITYAIYDNLVGDNGASVTSGGHPDWVQIFGTGHYSGKIVHNTFVMDQGGGAGTQGVGCGDGYFHTICPSFVVDDNLLLLTASIPPGGVSYAIGSDWSTTAYAEYVGNFVVPTGLAYGFCRSGYAAGQAKISGNVNVLTGAALGC